VGEQALELDSDSHLGHRRYFANHGLAICVPRTHHQTVEYLIQPKLSSLSECNGFMSAKGVPDLPDMLEAEFICVDADQAPDSQYLVVGISEGFRRSGS
jgi:hypothetical protein